GGAALGDIAHSLGATMPAFEAITGQTPWPARYTFSPAVRAGNLLFISGTTATDDGGELVAPGDIVEQTRVILRKFQRLLEAAGGRMEHIVQTTENITTPEQYRRTAAAGRGGGGVRQAALPDRDGRDRGGPAARGRRHRDLRRRRPSRLNHLRSIEEIRSWRACSTVFA